jgi:hypothetical protein
MDLVKRRPHCPQQSGEPGLQQGESGAGETVERDGASAYGQHHRHARSTNRIAVAPCSTGVIVMQRDAVQASAREEAELRWAREKIEHSGDMVWIRSMRKSQGYPHVGTVYQHISKAR